MRGMPTVRPRPARFKASLAARNASTSGDGSGRANLVTAQLDEIVDGDRHEGLYLAIIDAANTRAEALTTSRFSLPVDTEALLHDTRACRSTTRCGFPRRTAAMSSAPGVTGILAATGSASSRAGSPRQRGPYQQKIDPAQIHQGQIATVVHMQRGVEIGRPDAEHQPRHAKRRQDAGGTGRAGHR